MADQNAPSRPLEPNTAVSVAKGSPADEASSARLFQYLEAVAPLEGVDERGKREQLLNDLNALMKEWIREVAVAKGVYGDYETAAEAGGRLFISGSYRLGINAPDGDVDTVAVCPSFVTRDDFFGSWLDKLRSYADLESLNPIPDASVPILELRVAGTDVDMGFARVHAPTVPRNFNILDDNVLRGVEKTDVIAMNGPRVTELVARLVPHYESYTALVRALRLWAKQRGIYSNKMGFLGGVNFNIMGAYICQLYPEMPPAALLYRFFAVFAAWQWPKPVWITRPYKNAALGWDAEVFDAEDARQRSAVMPVITPAYPSSNSLYSVSHTSLRVMHTEFMRGLQCCFTILGSGDANRHDWSPLFAPAAFFLKFDSYLILDILAANDEDLAAWKGWVEARTRLLVVDLEKSGLPLNLVQPYPKTYVRTEAAEAAAPKSSGEAEAVGSAASDAAAVSLLASAIGGSAPRGAPTPVEGEGSHAPAPAPARTAKSKTYAYAEEGLDEAASSDAAGALLAAAVSAAAAAASSARLGSPSASPPPSDSSGEAGGALVGDDSVVAPTEEGAPVDFDTAVEESGAGAERAAPEAHLPTQAQVDAVKGERDVKVESGAEGGGRPTGLLPGIVDLTATPECAEEHAPESTAVTAAGPAPTRTVYSIFLGLEPDRERLKRSAGALNLTPALKVFKAERLYSWKVRKEGMIVRQRIVRWAGLPEEVFPDGRELAEVQRTSLKAAAARESSAAIAAAEAAQRAAQQARVFVRGEAGAGAGAAAQTQPVEAALSMPVAPLTHAQRSSVADASQALLLPARPAVAGMRPGVGAAPGGIPGLSSGGIPGLSSGGIPGLSSGIPGLSSGIPGLDSGTPVAARAPAGIPSILIGAGAAAAAPALSGLLGAKRAREGEGGPEPPPAKQAAATVPAAAFKLAGGAAPPPAAKKFKVTLLKK
jgi:poly(A) polymerase